MQDRDAPATAEETSIRQLIANGKHKTALDRAKEFHKAQRSAASEALLIDAYASRIQALLAQNMTLEAKSLLDLVRERYPTAKARLDGLGSAAAARAGALDELLAPLADASLDAERKAAIGDAVQRNVADLAVLAAVAVLPPDHPLRVAAVALDRALTAVTSGPVTDEQMALPEVSHRSPLAPWTMLVRAIAYFYRGEDARCRESLGAIKPESVPAQLIPAMRSMLGEKPRVPLTPAAAALASRAVASSSALRNELEKLEAAFEGQESEARIVKLLRSAMQECRRSAPGQVTALKRLLFVRSAKRGLDGERSDAALEGVPRLDATLYRMLARHMEADRDGDTLALACEHWDQFRQCAIEERWFAANGVEEATLYLHMAELLQKIPGEELEDLQTERRLDGKKGPDALYFLFPERLYGRACALDPHREAFAPWHEWAAKKSVAEGETVAKAWHKACPTDIEPLLFLMREAAKRSGFPSALGYLDKAERIDAVHSEVRAARLRLLAASALRHLQQKKPHLAAEKVAAMAELPQSRQDDRPAFLAAMRYLIALVSPGEPGLGEARAELEGLLGSDVPAGLLVASLALVSKCGVTVKMPPASSLGKAHWRALPAIVARLSDLAQDLGISKFKIAPGYLAEAERQFPGARASLNVRQLAALAEMALAEDAAPFAYAASGEGLSREGDTPGPAAARFLLLRARSLPGGAFDRRTVVAAAAVELARPNREMDIIEAALDLLKDDFEPEPLALTPEQAGEVVRREKTAPVFPVLGRNQPNYSDLLTSRLCNCPSCRRARGEAPDPFGPEDEAIDLNDMKRMFDDRVPGGIPPDAAEALFELMKNAYLNGESADDVLERLDLGGRFGGKGKKRKRK
jgi:hypothetical protein